MTLVVSGGTAEIHEKAVLCESRGESDCGEM